MTTSWDIFAVQRLATPHSGKNTKKLIEAIVEGGEETSDILEANNPPKERITK